MTYRSQSRGIRYTAPPRADQHNDAEPSGTESAETELTEADATIDSREGVYADD